MMQRVLSAFGWLPDQPASLWSSAENLEKVDLIDLFWLGNNVRMTRENAMKIGTVAKIRNRIAPRIGGLPLYYMKGGQRDASGVLTFLQQPDPARTRSSLLTWTVDQMLFYPVTWWKVTDRGAYGWPSAAELVMHADAETDDDGNLIKHRGQPVAARDVIRFDSPSAGLLIDGERTLRRAVVIEMAAAKAEDNPVPSFELHNDGDSLDRDGIEKILSDWINARRKYGVGYTSKGIKAQAHGIAPEQLLIEGQKRVDLQIVRHMNATARMADVPVEGSSLTYANLAQANRDEIDSSYALYMDAIADRLSLGDVTPRGWQVLFDTDRLTRDDMKTRFETYQIGKAAGFIDNAWIAAQEGWAEPMGVAS